MEEYIVYITLSANEDVENLYNYICFELNAPLAGIRLRSLLLEKISSLSTMPDRIKLMDNKRFNTLGLRMMVVENYNIIFRIVGNDVIIFRILYGASDVENNLMLY